ncbi:MAG: UDP-N-acetylmuramate dehydrogenase [Chlamydiia bacterium]
MSMPSWTPSIINENRPLSPFTTLKVGGSGRYVAIVRSVEELKEVLSFYRTVDLPLFVLGRGSNLVMGSGLIQAFFIVNQIQGIELGNGLVKVGSGVNVSYLSQKVAKMGFGGLEFFSGIPGTVGGSILMNAGAQNRETKDALVEVVTLDFQGKEHRYLAQDLVFEYRKSPFKGKKEIVVEATFRLTPDLEAEVKRGAILEKRLATQPYTAPTAGCMFKNPAGLSAGQLIDQAGLKGFQIGGVRVSKKHANFFENINNATAENVLELVEVVRYRVKNTTGIELELEVIPCFMTYIPTQPLPMES